MPSKASKAKARRSFRVDDRQDDANSDREDYNDELRTRRSINRVEGGPIFKTPSKQNTASEETSTDFFHCLKLAAENKISSKNAFGLQMIDYLGVQVDQKDSIISQNFQLASCSLDAGTKIYAARVDCVAKNVTDFAMVMTMANKKGGGADDLGDNDDEDKENEEDTLQAKKKRIKRLKRNQIFAKNRKDVQVDVDKREKANSVFPLLGNLMHEAVDSFNFTERSSYGAIEELLASRLESSEADKPMKIHMKELTKEGSLCPTLKKFSLEFELSENANELLNTSTSSLHGSPVISLKEFNESSLEDNLPEPDNLSFDGTLVEEVAACHQGDPTMVADRTSSTFTGAVAPMKMVNSGRMLQLHGPAFWKWKRPSLPVQLAKAAAVKKSGPKHVPIDFNAHIDLSKLSKKASKVFLQRDTVVKWDSSKITMPFDVSEADGYDICQEITKFSILPSEMIPCTVPLAPVEDRPEEAAAPSDEFFNDDHFPVDNPVAEPFDQEDSDDENNLPPLMEDFDAESFNVDLENLFKNSVLSTMSGIAPHMTNIGLDESNLISAPQVIETVLPEWKPARRFNMKKLEASLWEQIEFEKDGKVFDAQPYLHELYEHLPKKMQDSASMTTVLYALLNVANKKGICVKTLDGFSDCQVEHIPKLSRKSGVAHPAVDQEIFDD